MSVREKVLIVDDMDDILDILRFYMEAMIPQEDILLAKNAQEAIDLFYQNRYDIRLIVCDYNMPDRNGDVVYSEIRKISRVPFILHTSEVVDNKDAFVDNINFTHVPKPAIMAEFQELANLYLGKARVMARTLESYVAVNVVLLEKMKLIPVPLYVKIHDENFVRICHGNQEFSDIEAQKYINHKVTQLYIERKDIQDFIGDYQRRVFESVEGMRGTDCAFALTSASLDFIKQAQERLGFTREVQEMTTKNINMVLSLLGEHDNFKQILGKWQTSNNSYYAECASLVALISTSVAKKLNWVSDLTAQKLAFAAVLHDMTLSSSDVANMDLLREALSPAWKKKKPPAHIEEYRNHPAKASELVKNWQHCPPDVDTIILQHHELPDGSGFPSHLGHQRIAPLAALFIVAEDLARYILAATPQKNFDTWLFERRDYFSRSEFKKVVEVLAMSEPDQIAT